MAPCGKHLAMPIHGHVVTQFRLCIFAHALCLLLGRCSLPQATLCLRELPQQTYFVRSTATYGKHASSKPDLVRQAKERVGRQWLAVTAQVVKCPFLLCLKDPFLSNLVYPLHFC